MSENIGQNLRLYIKQLARGINRKRIKIITNLRYADDNLILARSEEEPTEIMKKLDRINKDHGLRLNKKKTIIMIIDKQPVAMFRELDRWF